MEKKRQRMQRESKKETNPKMSFSVTERNNIADRNSYMVTRLQRGERNTAELQGRQVPLEVVVRKISSEKKPSTRRLWVTGGKWGAVQGTRSS